MKYPEFYFSINPISHEIKKLNGFIPNKKVLENWFDIWSEHFNTLAYFDADKNLYYVSPWGFFEPTGIDYSDLEGELIKEIGRIENEVKKIGFIRTRHDSNVSSGSSVFTCFYLDIDDFEICIKHKSGTRCIIFKSYLYSKIDDKNEEKIVVMCQPDFPFSTLHIFDKDKFSKYCNISNIEDKKELAIKAIELFKENFLPCDGTFLRESGEYDFETIVIQNPYSKSESKHYGRPATYMPCDFFK